MQGDHTYSYTPLFSSPALRSSTCPSHSFRSLFWVCIYNLFSPASAAPYVHGCGTLYWSIGILSVPIFSKRTILSQQLSTANSFPVRGGAWKSSTTSLLDFWLLDRVQAVPKCDGYLCHLSRTQNLTALPHIFQLSHSFSFSFHGIL